MPSRREPFFEFRGLVRNTYKLKISLIGQSTYSICNFKTDKNALFKSLIDKESQLDRFKNIGYFNNFLNGVL